MLALIALMLLIPLGSMALRKERLQETDEELEDYEVEI
jgi:hypothetical protein